jgi:hypothetical protein
MHGFGVRSRRVTALCCAFATAIIGIDGSGTGTRPASAAGLAPDERIRAKATVDEVPLVFEPNVGQTDPSVKFLARADGGTVFVTEDAVVLAPAAGTTDAVSEEKIASAADLREIRQQPAFAIQDAATSKRAVLVRCVASGQGEVRFELGDYDKTRPLVIDPALVFATFLGGSESNDEMYAVAVDAAGNAYVTGTTFSSNFPTTPGAFDTTISPFQDTFVTKLNPTGSSLVYSTYLGGFFNEMGGAIAVDATGSAYVTGTTGSSHFPTTPGSFDTNRGVFEHAFVAKLAPGGNALTYSTFVGGDHVDTAVAIALRADGSVCVVGRTQSHDFATWRAGSRSRRTATSSW